MKGEKAKSYSILVISKMSFFYSFPFLSKFSIGTKSITSPITSKKRYINITMKVKIIN